MPSKPGSPARRKAQAKYNAKPEQIKRRGARVAARRKMIKAGKVRKGDGKDVAHRDGNPRNNKMSNLTSSSKKSNRSFKRTRSGAKKNKRD